MSSRGPEPERIEICARCGTAHGNGANACPAMLVGRTLAGRFHVVRLIGAGGTASVYKAQNLAIGRFVAVKVLHPHLRHDPRTIERFVREGRAMSRVRHEGVVDVFDLVSTDEGAPMLVLEYVRGRTLAAEIKRSGGFSLERAMDLVGQLLATLSAIHERGLVHRDLKPSNLLAGIDTRRRERLKVADFGLALDARSSRKTERVRVTPAGRVLATPRYLAPELLRGTSDGSDTRVDLYGAGLVLYEMLVGKPAFGSSDMDELADAILNARPPLVRAVRPEVPNEIDEVVTRALSKHPGARFPTAYSMLEALRPFGAASEVIDAEPTDSALMEMPRRPRTPQQSTYVPRAVPPAPPPSPPRVPSAQMPAVVPVAPASPAAAHPHSVFPRPGDADSTARRSAVKFDANGVPISATMPPPPPPLPASLPHIDEMSAEDLELMSSTRVRGVLAATLIDALRRRYDEPSVESILAGLPAVVKDIYRGPLRADAWVPGGALTFLLEVADDKLGRGDGALCIGFGRLAGHALLPAQESKQGATPESALIEAGSIWKRYFDLGELRIPAVGRGYGKLELRGLHPRRSTCLATAGFLEVLLERSGCRDVEIAIPQCRALGDVACTFDATWIV